MIPYKKKKAKE